MLAVVALTSAFLALLHITGGGEKALLRCARATAILPQIWLMLRT